MTSLAMPWPAPVQLQGVKSKKRAIFTVQKAVIVDGKYEVADVTLNLQSRILAVGEAGSAVVELLLGREPACGEVSRHKDMTVANLTPQNASNMGKNLYTFIADELAKRPQVVVIDEGSAWGDDEWTSVFNEILSSDELSNFQGAIVISCASEDHVAQLHCSTRWVATGSLLRPEEVCRGAEFFDDIFATDSHPSMLPPALLHEVTDLWRTCFGDFEVSDPPDLRTLALNKGWKVAVLADSIEKIKIDLDVDPSSQESHEAGCKVNSENQLLGFVAYNVLPGIGELHIPRLAVPMVHRRLGYGTQLIRWACERACSHEPQLNSVWLYATPDVELFYERVGFLNMGYMCDPSLSPNQDDRERYSWMMLDVDGQYSKHRITM